MAYSSFLSLSLGFLILFNCCFAQLEQVTSRKQQQLQQRLQTRCQIQNLNALEPKRRIESEAGVTEFWDQENKQLQCANVVVVRHRIQQRGLLVPSYNNAPQLIYVVQGRGIHGVVFPGCPETFQSDQSGQSQSFRSQRGQPSRDQHQKIRHIREGDVIALPTGVAHWIYNDGQSQLMLVSVVDLGNFENQLDQFYRKFVIAGSPQQEIQGAGRGYSESQSSRSRGEPGSRGNNILSAFNVRTLADSFNIDTELARRLQRDESQRGIIIRVQDELQVLSPQREERERGYESEERWERDVDNGIEETFCTMRLKHNINNPEGADVYNPRGGRITTVNAFNLPVLRHLELSAEKGTLYKNGLMAPHWNMNAHSIVYIVRGQGRLEIASEKGEQVFNGEIREGQLVVVPQNFAVVKRASSQGFEWIAFKTNAYAKISQLAGRVSVMRAMPVDVIRNAYDISREDAFRLKESRFETTVFSPGSQQRD